MAKFHRRFTYYFNQRGINSLKLKPGFKMRDVEAMQGITEPKSRNLIMKMTYDLLMIILEEVAQGHKVDFGNKTNASMFVTLDPATPSYIKRADTMEHPGERVDFKATNMLCRG